MRFPWPKESRLPNQLHLVASDPVWIAAVRRAVCLPQKSSAVELQLKQVPQAGLQPLPASAALLTCIEVSPDEVGPLCNALLRLRRQFASKLVVLLARNAFADPPHLRATRTALHEAGARLVLDRPGQAARVRELAFMLHRRVSPADDPLASLPIPCWDPAWQLPRPTDRV